MKDELVKALALDGHVRIYIARTTDMVQEARDRFDMGPIATDALGRTLSVASIMGGMLKSDISGFQYRQLEVYTTYQSQSGNVRLVGLCAAEDGGVIAGEDYSVRELHTGALRLRMLWQHGWLAVLVFWAVLAALVESVFSILHSPRLSVRLLLCQVLAATVLLGGVTAVQYRSFREIGRAHV